MSSNSHPPGEGPQPDGDRTHYEEDPTLALDPRGMAELEETREVTLRVEAKSTPEIPGLQIGELLGAGAMGEVFAGRQEYLNRDVAIKMLGARCSGESYQSRFKREATLLAGLTHENIVACYDAGISPDGRCFLVMERVLGPSLGSWVAENGPLSPGAALRVTVELSRALQHAHRKCTIIHRDVKPANVLLAPLKEPTPDGFPFAAKLADLGLARPADAECVDMALTAEGVILGTPSTMAPEQFDDPSGVDRRADIYALGCVLFFSLTGRSAFRGRSLSQVVKAKMVAQGPDALELRPDTPPSLAQLARRMMSAKANDRPQTYQELMEACSSLEMTTAESGGSSTRWALLGAGALALLAAAYGYWNVSSPEKPSDGAELLGKSIGDVAEQAATQGSPAATEPQVTVTPEPHVDEDPIEEAAPVVIEPPKLDWPREVLVQAGGPVLLKVEMEGPAGLALQIDWRWAPTVTDAPQLDSSKPLQVQFDAPLVQTVQALPLLGSALYAEGQDAIPLRCLVRVFPSAPPLKEEINLIVAEDYGDMPRYWSHREGGAQFGQLSADEGLFCRSMRKRTLHGIDLPGGSWTFSGTLAVSDGDPVPDRIGLVLTFPHGRRYEWTVLQGEPPPVVVQSYTQPEGAQEWQPDGEPLDLGFASLGEDGLPVSVDWSGAQLVIQSGKLHFSSEEPIAPKTLDFSVQGGAGELRIPKLLPRE